MKRTKVRAPFLRRNRLTGAQASAALEHVSAFAPVCRGRGKEAFCRAKVLEFSRPYGLFDSARGPFILLAARLYKMFLATINKPKQLLYMSFINHVRAEEMKQARENVMLLLAELAPGFRLLTDLERLNTLDQDCTPEIAYTMKLCDQKGIGMVVRVIPDPTKDIGLNILSRFHYKRGLRIVTCDSIEEAAKVLDL